MPHMVTAGIAPVSWTRMRGDLAALSAPIDETSVAAVGLAASYAYSPIRACELRVRFHYLKPFPARASLRRGLHQFRAVLGPVALASIVPHKLDVVAAFETGLAVHRMTATDEDTSLESPAHAVGWTASVALGVRGWVTWHTGFWGELRTGYARTIGRRDAFELTAIWPAEIMAGWADRF
jgi:hypothetical protein